MSDLTGTVTDVSRSRDASALRMYILAKDSFPDNRKLDQKIQRLKQTIQEKKDARKKASIRTAVGTDQTQGPSLGLGGDAKLTKDAEDDYHEQEDRESDDDFHYSVKPKKARPKNVHTSTMYCEQDNGIQTPRTKQLLQIVNTRDIHQIRLLKGVGAKKAEVIIEALCRGEDADEQTMAVSNLGQLSRMPGVGVKTVENMRSGLPSAASV